jgi:uncharacterized membrane protein
MDDADRAAGDDAFEDVYDELAELEAIVDSEAEREQVRETVRALGRTRRGRVVGRIRDAFDSRDAGEALVGSFVFGIPMVVEGGTLEIGQFIGHRPGAFAATLLLGAGLVVGILHAAEFEKVDDDVGGVPVRLVTIPAIAVGMSLVLMTAWGRVDWATPAVAAGQVAVTAVVMAVGASLGDILPGT